MEAEGVPVNDLYALLEHEPLCGKCGDSLHLTEEAYRKTANQVASAILAALGEG